MQVTVGFGVLSGLVLPLAVCVTALRFFFEYGVEVVLWPQDVQSVLGYPCDTQRLPISEATRAEIDRLSARYQSSLDWDDPMGPSPWPLEQREQFNTQARALLERIRSELPSDWVVEDRFCPL